MWETLTGMLHVSMSEKDSCFHMWLGWPHTVCCRWVPSVPSDEKGASAWLRCAGWTKQGPSPSVLRVVSVPRAPSHPLAGAHLRKRAVLLYSLCVFSPHNNSGSFDYHCGKHYSWNVHFAVISLAIPSIILTIFLIAVAKKWPIFNFQIDSE